MAAGSIGKYNVGRIAEHIASNELEYHGFRVSDLNKEGTSANADLLAVKNVRTWQIQVKGATYEGWWFNYGYCDQSMIQTRKCVLFNRSSHYYKAQVVVLVSVKTPNEYCCLVMPIEKAEEVAQITF